MECALPTTSLKGVINGPSVPYCMFTPFSVYETCLHSNEYPSPAFREQGTNGTEKLADPIVNERES